MATTPLMPKATAVWLVENTALSFDQVAEFCKLHPLEVKAIADGDSAQGIKGLDPILTGQLNRDEIEKAEADPKYKLSMATPNRSTIVPTVADGSSVGSRIANHKAKIVPRTPSSG